MKIIYLTENRGFLQLFNYHSKDKLLMMCSTEEINPNNVLTNVDVYSEVTILAQDLQPFAI